VGEDELRHSLGLATCTTGKGKVALDPNTRAIEVFMCSVVSLQCVSHVLTLQSAGVTAALPARCCWVVWAVLRAVAAIVAGEQATQLEWLLFCLQALALQCATELAGHPSIGLDLRNKPTKHVVSPAAVCCVLQAKRMGYGDGFRWMSQYIK
jgi:hypothetical protein